MAGLYAIDELLSEAKIAQIVTSMYQGNDVLQLCQSCFANSESVQGSTSSDKCQCHTGAFEETIVLNPSLISRRYSSIFLADHVFSMLNEVTATGSWSALANSVGQYIEIDTIEPMKVAGFRTQGRGTTDQFVREFRVEYRSEMGGFTVVIPGTFSMTTGLEKEHLFASPVYARHIRIIVLQWNVHISMRAALVVKLCTSCPAGGIAPRGSTSVDACQCPGAARLYVSAANNRAMALVLGRVRLSTLANRNVGVFTATATFDSNAGPLGGIGAVTFDRRSSKHLDGGPAQFNIATNRGFTYIAVVKLQGSIGAHERLFDSGKGASNDNIAIYRNAGSDFFLFVSPRVFGFRQTYGPP